MNTFFSKKLKELREVQGLLQKDLAEDFNLDKTTISAWERGKSYPDVEKLIKLSEYFKVSTDELLGLKVYPIQTETKQDNEINEIIKTYKKLSDRQKKHIRINLYTLADDQVKLENEIRSNIK